MLLNESCEYFGMLFSEAKNSNQNGQSDVVISFSVVRLRKELPKKDKVYFYDILIKYTL